MGFGSERTSQVADLTLIIDDLSSRGKIGTQWKTIAYSNKPQFIAHHSHKKAFKRIVQLNTESTHARWLKKCRKKCSQGRSCRWGLSLIKAAGNLNVIANQYFPDFYLYIRQRSILLFGKSYFMISSVQSNGVSGATKITKD